MSHTLLIPIHIDVQVIAEGPVSCAEPRLDFSRLPYFNGHTDVNPYVAYLGEEIQSIPFKNGEFQLQKGIHLHWALPDALTRSFRHPMLDLTALRRVAPERAAAFGNDGFRIEFTESHFSADALLAYFMEVGWVKRLPGNDSFASIVAGSEQMDMAISQLLATNRNPALGQAILGVRYLLEPGGTQMPPVPNRWLVTRTSTNTNIPTKHWIVESDHIAAAETEGLNVSNAVPFPRWQQNPTDAPFGWLGRKYEWLPGQERPNGGQYMDSALTAMGYGDPTFAAFYPNCHSVFGFHDDLFSRMVAKDVDGKVVMEPEFFDAFAEGFTYEVIGYYASQDADYLRIANLDMVNRVDAGGLAKALHSLYHDELQLDFGADLDELLHIDGSMEAFDLLNILPDRLLCGAQVTIAGDANSWKTAPANHLSLAVGNSGAEALATFLGDKISAAQKLEVEEYLESLQFASSLDHLETDIGPKFIERRHQQGFATEHGGWRWTLRPPQKQTVADAETNAEEQVSLPDELAHFLHKINALQLDFDRIDARIKSLRQQIYADWSKYMAIQYPPDGSDDEYPDADEARFYIEMELLPRLEAMNQARQNLAQALRKHVESFWLFRAEDVADWDALYFALSARFDDQRTREEMERDRNNFTEAQLLEGLNNLLRDPDALRNTLHLPVATSSSGEFEAVQPFDHLATNRRLLESIVPSLVSAHSGLELKLKPDHYFYRPTDPVVLLAGDALKLSEKHGQDGLLRCLFLPEFDLDMNTAATLESLTAMIRNAGAEEADSLWQQMKSSPSNYPLLLDWLVEYFPVKDPAKEAGETEGYSATYVQDSYGLALNKIDFEPTSTAFAEAGQNFWGTAILTPDSAKNVKQALEIFLKAELGKLDLNTWYHSQRIADEDRSTDIVLERMESFSEHYFSEVPDGWLRAFFVGIRQQPSLEWFRVQAQFDTYFQWDAAGVVFDADKQPTFSLWESKHLVLAILSYNTLHETHYLSQSLGGFTQALLMQRQGFQLNIADPLGYPEYQAFSERVSQAVGLLKHASTLPNNPFFPVRAGAVSLVELRLLDTFGTELAHLKDIPTSAQSPVLASEPLRPLESHHLHLAPRLVQPARLNFHWLSADDDDMERNEHPAASPVCGWLLINTLDESLMVYDRAGAALGYLDRVGHWRAFPGHDGPFLPEGIENRHLRRMVRWLGGKAQAAPGAGVIPHFLQVLEAAIQKIEPARADQAGEGVAMLMSRPLALVRASAQLELKGLPAVHQGWSEFQALLEHPDARHNLTHNVENVTLPLRLGEDHQLNDGLIGFWEDADDGDAYREDSFRIPSLHRSTSGSVDTDHAILDSLTVGNTGSNAPDLRFSLLMDPHGAVHATCGILPVQKLELPADLYADVLKRLEVSFLTAPVITPERLVNISLPDEPGFHWSWISMENRQWREISTIGQFRKRELEAAFGEAAELLWTDLLANNWITAQGDEATILPANQRKANEAFPAAELATAIGIFLASRQIGVFQTTPNFHGPQEIREGWLKLRPAPELPLSKKEA